MVIKRNRKYIIISLLFVYSPFLFSQEVFYSDTLIIGKKQIILSIPAKSIKSVESYTEGTFILYNILSDTALITIHSGSMVSLPLMNDTNCIILSDTYLKKENRIKFQRRKGVGSVNNDLFFRNNVFFREDNYYECNISILYQYVNEFQLNKYDSILDNVKINIYSENPRSPEVEVVE